MTVVLIVALLVAGISLYDYFSARNWQQVTSADRNEIVFADRNKEYGAYTMRRDYDKRMVIILVSFVATLALSFGIFAYVKSIPEEVIEIKPVDVSTIPPAKPEEELPPPPPEPPVPVLEKLTQFLPPVIVNEEVDEVPPIQENLEDKKISTINQEGSDDSFNASVGPAETVVEAPKVEQIYEAVEEDAEFPGGKPSDFVSTHFNPDAAADVEGKIIVRFVVELDGSISNVEVARGLSPEANREAIRVVRSMPRWKPGKNNGKAVRSRFSLPILIGE
jgi:protein TonB